MEWMISLNILRITRTHQANIEIQVLETIVPSSTSSTSLLVSRIWRVIFRPLDRPLRPLASKGYFVEKTGCLLAETVVLPLLFWLLWAL